MREIVISLEDPSKVLVIRIYNDVQILIGRKVENQNGPYSEAVFAKDQNDKDIYPSTPDEWNKLPTRRYNIIPIDLVRINEKKAIKKLKNIEITVLARNFSLELGELEKIISEVDRFIKLLP